MIRIAIADDHKLFRKSLAMLVTSFPGITVVSEADNGATLLELLKIERVDIILLDLNMPEMDGFEACKIIRSKYPEIKILIISQRTSEDSVHKILALDAHGYFTKNSDPKMLQAAINELSSQGYYFEDGFNNFLREAWYAEGDASAGLKNNTVVLTKREIEIVKMAALEYNSVEIGNKLHISLSTVETHRKNIIEKTNSKNFIGAVLFALRNNYIHFSDLSARAE